MRLCGSRLKKKTSAIYGAQFLHKSIVISRYLSSELKDFMNPVSKRNGFIGYSENVLILILADERNHIRQLALQSILKTCKVKRSAEISAISKSNFCRFILPVFSLCGTDYVDLVNGKM